MRKVVWLVVVFAVVSAVANASGFSPIDELAERPERLAVRAGARTQTRTIPPPVLYPESPCQSIIPEPIESINPARAPHDLRRIGTSVLRRPIYAERWGSATSQRNVVIVAQTHGNECAVIHALQTLRQFASPVRLWIIPTINPDGMLALERRNANGVDLNADGGFVSQPETLALRDFVSEVTPELVVFLHSPNGFAGSFPVGGRGDRVCLSVGRVGIRCSANGAGTRPTNRWFLWQMVRQASPSTDSVLIEFFAISSREVTTARPRPPHRPASSAVATAQAVVDALV